MPLKLWNGSSFAPAIGHKLWNGSSWEDSRKHIWNGSAWVDCISDIDMTTVDGAYDRIYELDQPSPGAGQGLLEYVFEPGNGIHEILYSTSVSSTITESSGFWITPAISKCVQNYEVRATGSGINFGDTLNVWHDLATSGILSWGINASQSGTESISGSLQVQIRRKGTAIVISESNLFLSVTAL